MGKTRAIALVEKLRDILVRGTGLEPARLSALAPKASASANSAIPAQISFMVSLLGSGLGTFNSSRSRIADSFTSLSASTYR